MAFSDGEVERYARHLILREIGGAGQQRLKAARVLLVGLGGLGSGAAPALAAAGVGTLVLADGDAVSLSNLQRQTLYATADVGRPKVEAAAERLAALNPGTCLERRPVMLDGATAAGLVAGCDLALDGTDDFAARFSLNAASFAAGVPLLSGAVERWTGQVALFTAGLTRGRPGPERAPCYRCLVPDTPPDAETCARTGVAGPLAPLVGALMALEAVKWLADAGRPLDGRLLVYDALSAESRTVRLVRDPACPVCGDGAATTLM